MFCYPLLGAAVLDPGIVRELERRTEDMGFEFVDLETGGTRVRPVLRLRIDRPDSEPGRGVTLDECTFVSRALQAYLDELPEIPETYVLEVSSPGIERPLVRPRDYARFAGRDVRVRTGNQRLEGVLLGLKEGEGESIRLRLPDGSEPEIPLSEVRGANLIHRWNKTSS